MKFCSGRAERPQRPSVNVGEHQCGGSHFYLKTGSPQTTSKHPFRYVKTKWLKHNSHNLIPRDRNQPIRVQWCYIYHVTETSQSGYSDTINITWQKPENQGTVLIPRGTNQLNSSWYSQFTPSKIRISFEVQQWFPESSQTKI